MKISILMPVFNEEENITEAIDSVLAQTVSNWELIIIDDGSTDGTVNVIHRYNDSRIVLLSKENSDQLDSIKYALPYITGELVYLLHGDDRLYSCDVFEKTQQVFKDKLIDYISYPYCEMDGLGVIKSIHKPKAIYVNNFLKANLLLNFGRNLRVDHFFCRKEYLFTQVLTNYINRNKPFWMDVGDNFGAKSYTVDYPVFDYRCHEGNYLNSDVGLYNVINGNIRSTLDLLAIVSVPFFTVQRYLFKVYNKLGLIGLPVLYRNKPTTGMQSLTVLKLLLDIYQVDFDDYRLLKLVKMYQSDSFLPIYDLSNKSITESEKFGPAQVRLLNKAILDNKPEQLPIAFYELLEALEKGIGEVVCSAENRVYVEEYLDLLNIRLKVSNV